MKAGAQSRMRLQVLFQVLSIILRKIVKEITIVVLLRRTNIKKKYYPSKKMSTKPQGVNFIGLALNVTLCSLLKSQAVISVYSLIFNSAEKI